MCHECIVYQPPPKKTSISIVTLSHYYPLIHCHTLRLANGSSSCHLLLPFTGQGQRGRQKARGGECADDLGFPVAYTWPRVVVMVILLLTLLF